MIAPVLFAVFATCAAYPHQIGVTSVGDVQQTPYGGAHDSFVRHGLRLLPYGGGPYGGGYGYGHGHGHPFITEQMSLNSHPYYGGIYATEGGYLPSQIHGLYKESGSEDYGVAGTGLGVEGGFVPGVGVTHGIGHRYGVETVLGGIPTAHLPYYVVRDVNHGYGGYGYGYEVNHHRGHGVGGHHEKYGVGHGINHDVHEGHGYGHGIATYGVTYAGLIRGLPRAILED